MTQKPNLIGVAGRIGSGKDTVGSIIKYWLNYRREHKAGAYSSYVLMDHWYNSKDWQVKKFAGKLKEVASLLTGIPADQFEDQEFKSTALGEKWSYYEDGCSNDMTVRLFLQKLGTEAIRNGLHTNAWVNALFADYKDVNQSEDGLIHEKCGEHDITIVPNPILWSEYYPHWIITDLRFLNEFEAIKDRRGVCIRVERYPKEIIHNQGTDKQSLEKFDITNEEHRKLYEGENFRKGLHPSETALDSHSFDYVLNNSGSIEDLVKEIRKMLVHFKLIES